MQNTPQGPDSHYLLDTHVGLVNKLKVYILITAKAANMQICSVKLIKSEFIFAHLGTSFSDKSWT